MYKTAFEAGVEAALEKLALSEALKARAAAKRGVSSRFLRDLAETTAQGSRNRTRIKDPVVAVKNMAYGSSKSRQGEAANWMASKMKLSPKQKAQYLKAHSPH